MCVSNKQLLKYIFESFKSNANSAQTFEEIAIVYDLLFLDYQRSIEARIFLQAYEFQEAMHILRCHFLRLY